MTDAWAQQAERARIRKRRMALALVAAAALFGLVAGLWVRSALAETVDGHGIVIVDGDTFAIGSERVRLENIDAPESFRSRCEAELVAGLKAKERLAELLRAGPVEIIRSGEDRYRRTLARVRAGGRDVGEVLVRERLALPWQDGAAAREGRLVHWCGQTGESSAKLG